MQPIKIFCPLLCDAKVTFNPEKMEVLYFILSYIFCCKAILNLKRNIVFHHIFYHMSFAGKEAILNPKGRKFSFTRKQGYPISTKIFIKTGH